MSWRGQGGKRAKGRRGDQDPELDNTAWLAELEREAAAQADEDEDDWASTLRGRRSPVPSPAPAPPRPPRPEDDWAPDPAPSPAPDDRLAGAGPGADQGTYAWSGDPAPPPATPDPEPDWSWRRPAADAFGAPEGPSGTAQGPDLADGTEWGEPRGDAGDGWRSAGLDTATGAWSPVEPDAPAPAGPYPGYDPVDPGPGYPAGEPVGREPDYPALFGELYRRSASQQDPIWEAPPAAEPLPEHGPPDPPPPRWPFEETTQSWEPRDSSFVWPADELPSGPAEWEQPTPPSWMDDPGPSGAPSAHTPAPPRPDPVPPPDPDQTAAWTAPDLGPASPWAAPEPAARPSLWEDQPGAGNGVPPPTPAGPPPADWAAAIPTDIPAARRAADPAATRAAPLPRRPGAGRRGLGGPNGRPLRQDRPGAGRGTGRGGRRGLDPGPAQAAAGRAPGQGVAPDRGRGLLDRAGDGAVLVLRVPVAGAGASRELLISRAGSCPGTAGRLS
jgi:hypothetical protein